VEELGPVVVVDIAVVATSQKVPPASSVVDITAASAADGPKVGDSKKSELVVGLFIAS